MSSATVLIGVPAGNGWIFGPCVEAVYGTHGHDGPTMAKQASGSMLTHTFNRLLGFARVGASSGLLTHFAMVHNDVVPAENWLRDLLAEYERTDADVLSAVIAIKSFGGHTSTALGDPHDWYDFRRIMTRELGRLPPTFDADDCRRQLDWPRPTDCLLVNTGCWITDMRKPIWSATNPDGTYALRFHTEDRQWLDPADPQHVLSECAPEDWNFSRDLHRMGAKVYATRAVSTYHAVTQLWGTRPAWGAETDTEAEDFRQQYGRPDWKAHA